MKNSVTFVLPPALQSNSVKRLFATLGRENLRFVGGCVRDTLMGEPIGDIDLATPLFPDQVMGRLKKAGIAFVPTGIDFGTVTAVLDGVGYEITTLRRDIKTDGRHAEVAYGTCWEEDAARRDFTINALYADSEGRVFDPLGYGLADVAARRVRFVGDPHGRIQEDYLRILRFFRFYTLYGRGAMDKKALIAIIANRGGLAHLSRERVTCEMKRIVLAEASAKTLVVMAYEGIIPALFSSTFDPKRFVSLQIFQKEGEDQPDDLIFLARLIVLADFKSRVVRKVFNILILNKNSKKAFDIFVLEFNKTKRIDSKKITYFLYKYPRPVVRVLLDLWALRHEIPAAEHKRWVEFSTHHMVPHFPITGKDLLALGFESGPELGEELLRLEKKWIRSGFRLNKKELLL
ncbi:MAG: CCA tRNA nucleotidyltransferase [Pseudobdellovibrionaceae bacterium]